MWRSARRALVGAVATLSLAVPLAACSAPLPNGNGNCTLNVDYPHGSTTLPGYIDGKGKVTCVYSAGKLTNLTIETQLQRRSGSAWITVAGTSKKTTISTVKSGVQYTGVSGFLSCRSGTFRTQSRAGGYLDGRYSGLSAWQTTNTSKGAQNPCVKPLKIVNT